MAVNRIARAVATIDLKVEGADKVKAELEKVYKAKQVAEENGKIKYLVDLDESSATRVRQMMDELNTGGKNLIKIALDEGWFQKSTKNLEGIALTEAQRIGQLFNSIFNESIDKIEFNKLSADLATAQKDLENTQAKLNKTLKAKDSGEINKLKKLTKIYLNGEQDASFLGDLEGAYNAVVERYKGDYNKISKMLGEIKVGQGDEAITYNFDDLKADILWNKEKFKNNEDYIEAAKYTREDIIESMKVANSRVSEYEKNIAYLNTEINRLNQEIAILNASKGDNAVTYENLLSQVRTALAQVQNEVKATNEKVIIDIEPGNISNFIEQIEKHKAKINVEVANAEELAETLNVAYLKDRYNSLFNNYQGRDAEGRIRKKYTALKTSEIESAASEIYKNAQGRKLSEKELINLLALGNNMRMNSIQLYDSRVKNKGSTEGINLNTEIFEDAGAKYGHNMDEVSAQLKALADRISIQFVDSVQYTPKTPRPENLTGDARRDYERYYDMHKNVEENVKLDINSLSEKITEKLEVGKSTPLNFEQLREVFSLIEAHNIKSEDKLSIDKLLGDIKRFRSRNETLNAYKDIENTYRKQEELEIARQKKEREENQRYVERVRIEQEKQTERDQRAEEKRAATQTVPQSEGRFIPNPNDPKTFGGSLEASLDIFVPSTEIEKAKLKIEEGISPIKLTIDDNSIKEQMSSVEITKPIQVEVSSATIVNSGASTPTSVKSENNTRSIAKKKTIKKSDITDTSETTQTVQVENKNETISSLNDILLMYHKIRDVQEQTFLNLSKLKDKDGKINNAIINPEDIVKSGDSVKKPSVKRLFSEYDAISKDTGLSAEDKSAKLDELQKKMTAYVYCFKDVDALSKEMGEKHPQAWTVVTESINKSNEKLERQKQLAQEVVLLVAQIEGGLGRVLTKNEKNAILGGKREAGADLISSLLSKKVITKNASVATTGWKIGDDVYNGFDDETIESLKFIEEIVKKEMYAYKNAKGKKKSQVKVDLLNRAKALVKLPQETSEPLTNQQVAQLIGYEEAYKQMENNYKSFFATAMENIYGKIDWDKFTPNHKELDKAYQTILSRQTQNDAVKKTSTKTIMTTTTKTKDSSKTIENNGVLKLNTDPKNIAEIKNKVQTTLNGLTVKIKDISVAPEATEKLKTKIQQAIEGVGVNVNPNVVKDTLGSDGKTMVESVRSVGSIVKEMMEADTMMKSVKEKGIIRERALMFNSKTGYMSNSYLSGKEHSVPGSLTVQMMKSATEKFDSNLHTHPGGHAFPSDGDIRAFVKELELGIVRQFIATTKEVLSMDLSGVKHGDLKDIADEFSRIGQGATKKYQDPQFMKSAEGIASAYSVTNADKYIQGKYLTETINKSLADGQQINSLNQYIDQVYQNIKNVLIEVSQKFTDKEFDFAKMFKNVDLSKIIPEGLVDNINQSKFSDNLGKMLQDISSDKVLYSKYAQNDNERILKSLFTEKGYNPDEIMKRYTLDEFEKIYSQRQQIQQENVGATIYADNKNIENLKTTLITTLSPVCIDVHVSPQSLENAKKELEASLGGVSISSITANKIPTSNEPIVQENEQLEQQKEMYAEIDRLLDSILSKKDIYLKGEKDTKWLAKRNPSGELIPASTGKAIIKNDAYSINSIKNTIKEYNQQVKNGDSSGLIEITKQRLIELVSSYKNVDDAASAFGEKNKALWIEIKQRIEDAKASKEASFSMTKNIQLLFKNVKKTTDKNISQFDFYNGIRNSLFDGGKGTALNYISGLLSKSQTTPETAVTPEESIVSSLNVNAGTVNVEGSKVSSFTKNDITSTEGFMDKILSLKDASSIGKNYRDAISTKDEDGFLKLGKFVRESDLKNGLVTIPAIKKAIGSYNSIIANGGDGEDAKKRVIGLVTAYKDVDKAASAFGTKNVGLWEDVKVKIEQAKASATAYEEILKNLNNISNLIGATTGSRLTNEDAINFSTALNSGGKNAAWGYLLENNLKNIDPNVLKQIPYTKENTGNAISVDLGLNVAPEAIASVKNKIEAGLKDIKIGLDSINVNNMQEVVKTLETALSNIKATIDPTIGGAEKQANNSATIEKSVANINKLNDKSVSLNVSATPDIETLKSNIKDIKTDINSLKDKDIALNVKTTPTVEELKTDVQGINENISNLQDKTVSLAINTTPNIKTLKTNVEAVKASIDGLNDKSVSVNFDTSQDVGELKTSIKEIGKIISGLKNKSISLSINTTPDIETLKLNVENIKTNMDTLKDKSVALNVNVGKNGKNLSNDIKNIVDSINGSNSKDVEINVKLNNDPNQVADVKDKIKNELSQTEVVLQNLSIDSNVIGNEKNRLRDELSKTRVVLQNVSITNNVVKGIKDKIKTSISSLNHNVEIKISSKTDKTKDEDNLQASLNNLLSTDFSAFNSAFNEMTTNVQTQSNTQVEAIRNVINELNVLKEAMKDIGLEKVLDVEKYSNMILEIEKAGEKAAKKIKEAKSNKKPKEDTLKEDKKEVSDLTKFKNAVNSTKGMVFAKGGFPVETDGIINYTAKIEDADGKIRTITGSIRDLNSILTETGTINIGSLLDSSTFIDNIDNAINSFRALNKESKVFDQVDHFGMLQEDVDAQRLKYKNEIAEAEVRLKEEVNNSYLSESKRLDVLKQIEEIKEQEISVMGTSRNATQEKTIQSANDKYQKLFGGFDTQEKIDAAFMNKMADVGGEKVNLREYVAALKDQAIVLKEQLTTGAFESNEEFKKLNNQLLNVYSTMQQISSDENFNTGIIGKFSTVERYGKNNLDELENYQKRETIEEAFREKYGNKGLLVDVYQDGVGSKVQWIEDGKYKTAIVTLEKYTSAFRDNTAAAIENAQALEDTGNVIIRVGKLQEKGEALNTGAAWIDSLKKKIGSLTQYLTGMGIIMRAVRMIREGFAFVKELDANMTTIHQTMDITTKGLEELSVKSIEASKNLGAVATEMLKSVNIYAAYGKTVDEIINQATPTVMLANASGAGAEQASDYIQAVVQQYEELKGQETKIVNAYEKIAANVQIDFSKAVQGISEGVQVAGSVMNEANVEFETYAASLAKIIEKTRTDGSQVGNALKTIASRISRSSSGDEDVSEEDRSKASAAYSSIGISVYNDDGSYRGLSTILDELSAKWDELTDAQRNYIAEQSAGVRNINMFNTMLDTWNEAKQLAAEANEDTDYYMEVQEKWMESMTAKMNTLKATFQEFWYNLIDVEVVNIGIDLLTTVLKGVEVIVNAGKSLGSVFGELGGTIGGLAGAFTTVFVAASGWQSFTKKLNTGDGIVKMAGFKGISDSLKGLGKKFLNFGNIFINTCNESMLASNDLFKSITTGAKAAWKNLSTFAKISIIAIGATLAAKAFDTLTTSSKEAAEVAKEASDAYKENQSSLKSNRQTINEIGLEYDKLSDGVDQFGNNISLTAEEFDRYHEICNKIADMYPNLVKSYDEQGNAILKLKGKVEELNAEYEKQQLNAARKNVSSLGAYIEDTKNITGNRSGLTEFVDMIGDWGDPDVGGQITNKEAVEILEKIQKMSNDEFKKFFSADYNDNEYDEGARYIASDELMNIGFWEGMYLTDENVNSKEFEERINAMRDKIPELLAKYTSEINDKAANVKTGLQDLIKIMQLDPDSYPEFKNADTTVFDRAKNLISSMTIDQIDKFMAMGDETEIENAFRKYVYDIVSVLNSNEEAKLSLENILGLNEESSVEDIKKALSVDLEKLSEALKINKAELKVQLGLEDEEEFIKMYNNTLESASKAVSNSSRFALGEVYEEFKDNVTSLDLSTRIIDSNKLINKDSNIEFDGELGASFNTKTFVSDDATKAVVVTPVLPDGTVLNDKDLKEYAEKLLKGEKIDVDIKVAAFNGKDAEKQAKTFADRLKKASKTYTSITNASKRVKEFMREQNINTANEVALLQKCVDETDSWAEAMRKFKRENVDLKLNDEIIDGLKANLELVEKTIENVDEAAKASYSATGLTSEQIENIKNAFGELKGFDYDQLFESTAEGVHLNAQELDRLNGKYEKFQKAKYAEILDKLEEEYAGLCIGINETATATERIDLINKRDGVLEQIQKVQELASQYEGLTNAVSNYKRAKELGEEGDTFLEIQGDLEKIEELWNHGLVGTNQFKAAVQMMTNKDMSGASVEDYVNTYKDKIEQFKSWITEDASGLQTFLYDLKELGMADVDGSGVWSIDGSIKAMAEGLGTSESLIQEIFKRLKDYGFDVDFEEETNHLKNLKNEAIAVRDAITNENYKLDLEVKNKDDLEEQIKIGEELLKVLGDDEEAYEKVQKQIDYLKAKAGETADAMNFSLNYTDNKDEIDSVITKLHSLEKYKDIYINFENVNINNVEGQIDNVKSELEKLKDPETGKINFKTEGASELADILISLYNKKIELTNTSAILKLDYHNLESDYAIVAEKLQDIKNVMNEIDSLEAQAALGVDISEDKEKLTGDLNNLIAELNTGTDTRNEVLISMGFDVSKNETIKENMQTVLDGLTAEKLVEIGFITPEQAKAELGYVVADTEKNVEIKILEAEWAAWKADADKDRTTNLHVKTIRDEYDEFIQEISNTRLEQKVTFTTDNSGISTPTSPASSTQVNVNGNANVYGNARTGLFKKGAAFAKGAWGAAKSGMSLVGELGRELVKLLPV